MVEKLTVRESRERYNRAFVDELRAVRTKGYGAARDKRVAAHKAWIAAERGVIDRKRELLKPKAHVRRV